MRDSTWMRIANLMVPMNRACFKDFCAYRLECHLANCKRRKEQRFEVDQVVEKIINHRNFLDI